MAHPVFCCSKILRAVPGSLACPKALFIELPGLRGANRHDRGRNPKNAGNSVRHTQSSNLPHEIARSAEIRHVLAETV